MRKSMRSIICNTMANAYHEDATADAGANKHPSSAVDLSKHPKSLPEARIAIATLQTELQNRISWEASQRRQVNKLLSEITEMRDTINGLRTSRDQANQELTAAKENADRHAINHSRIVSEFAGYQTAIHTIITGGGTRD
jgi:uncharacterized coiled-coil DUF342 family protein